jgi:hypothetical protein
MRAWSERVAGERTFVPTIQLLSDALMRPGSIEIFDIGMQDTIQLLLLEDEQVIKTLSSHAAQKPFADCIGSWRMGGVMSILMPLVAATRAKRDPNLPSRSRMREFGDCP